MTYRSLTTAAVTLAIALILLGLLAPFLALPATADDTPTTFTLPGGVEHTFTNPGTVTATIVEVFGKQP